MDSMVNPFISNEVYTVDIYQDKEEWRIARGKGIGGSDASCIVGQNPYKQSYELWREKKGLVEPKDISDKPYVRYGTLAEEHLRHLFELDFEDRYEVYYLENATLQSIEYPFMRYSPDGILYDKLTGKWGLLEIKTTNIVQSSQKEKWEKDNIPSNYYCQVIHGLNVTKFEFVVLKAQLKYENSDGLCNLTTRHYYWGIDNEQVHEDMEYLKQEEVKWWNDYFLKGIMPPVQIEI